MMFSSSFLLLFSLISSVCLFFTLSPSLIPSSVCQSIPHCVYQPPAGNPVDFSPLAGANHGNDFTVATYNEDGTGATYIYTFALCRPIWDFTSCPGKPLNTTICQYNANQTAAYDISDWGPIAFPEVTTINPSGAADDGITLSFVVPGSGGRRGTISVYCPGSPNAPNVGDIVVSLVGGDPSYHLFQMSLPEACPYVNVPSNCAINGVSYLSALSNVPDLQVTSTANQEPGIDPIPYLYTFAMCRPIVNPQCLFALNGDVAICQQTADGSNPIRYYDIANWIGQGQGMEFSYITGNPFDGVKFIWTEFGSADRLGEFYVFCPFTSLSWAPPLSAGPVPNFKAYGPNDHVHGFNVTRWEACPPGSYSVSASASASASSTGGGVIPPIGMSSSSTGTHGSPDQGPSGSGLSGGWVFCIIVFCLSFVYCVGGCGYNKYRGAHGVSETVPQFALWSGLMSLASDGCVFAFHKIRQIGGCAPKKTSRRLIGGGYEDIETMNN